MLSAARKTQFVTLFTQFAEEYLSQPQGQTHLQQYELDRAQGQKNFEEIEKEKLGGQFPTEKVLHKLLPHTDTAPHRKLGVWISIAPAITGDIRNWFEAVGWTRPEDWPKIAAAILKFVEHSAKDPSSLEASCKEFVSLPYTRGLQTGILTPILNALRKDDYIIINNKSRTVINFFSEQSFKQRLLDYPVVNASGRKLIAEMKDFMLDQSKIEARPEDLFDMFCHWLVAINKQSPVYGGRSGAIHTPGGKVAVTVPDDEADVAATPSEAETQSRESYKVQAALAEIGAKMGFQIWIPLNDRGKVLQEAPDLQGALLDELPLNYISTTLDTIERIDVIWIKGHSIARAFEVEHTTAVYSGLLRMADLLALQPDINIRLHIVAPDAKHDKVMREIKRPIFSALEKGPLYRRCSFIPYSSVYKLHALKQIEYMKDLVLEEYEEFAQDE
jgi:hypothetical protein